MIWPHEALANVVATLGAIAVVTRNRRERKYFPIWIAALCWVTTLVLYLLLPQIGAFPRWDTDIMTDVRPRFGYVPFVVGNFLFWRTGVSILFGFVIVWALEKGKLVLTLVATFPFLFETMMLYELPRWVMRIWEAIPTWPNFREPTSDPTMDGYFFVRHIWSFLLPPLIAGFSSAIIANWWSKRALDGANTGA